MRANLEGNQTPDTLVPANRVIRCPASLIQSTCESAGGCALLYKDMPEGVSGQSAVGETAAIAGNKDPLTRREIL